MQTLALRYFFYYLFSRISSIFGVVKPPSQGYTISNNQANWPFLSTETHMIVQYKPGHYIDFRNIVEAQFHDSSLSVHIKSTGSNVFSYDQYDEDAYNTLKESWISYITEENENRGPFKMYEKMTDWIKKATE